jgi:hypothetical protein
MEMFKSTQWEFDVRLDLHRAGWMEIFVYIHVCKLLCSPGLHISIQV